MAHKKHLPDHADTNYLEEQDALTDTRLERIQDVARKRQRGLIVLMENVFNPYNLAAIARTCDAMGIQELAFTSEDGEPFNPEETGALASRSAAKWMTYTYHEGHTAEVLTQLKEEGYFILATSAEATAPNLGESNLVHPKMVLLVGNERRGISPTAIALADGMVKIPMVGMVQSLNVSVATAIILYEIVRQRQNIGNPYRYTPEEATALTETFVQRHLEDKEKDKQKGKKKTKRYET